MIKRIYFDITENLKECLPEDYTGAGGSLKSIWEFNNQAISMNMFCTKYTESEETYISATPTSIEGSKFVINAFKKSVKPVLIKGAGTEFPVSAKRFSKVWN
ncbi:MAG: hypothetical protein DRJ10_01890, partial [Bacteroidetes bacterium]